MFVLWAMRKKRVEAKDGIYNKEKGREVQIDAAETSGYAARRSPRLQGLLDRGGAFGVLVDKAFGV